MNQDTEKKNPLTNTACLGNSERHEDSQSDMAKQTKKTYIPSKESMHTFLKSWSKAMTQSLREEFSGERYLLKTAKEIEREKSGGGEGSEEWPL